jgi:hypothetical protein
MAMNDLRREAFETVEVEIDRRGINNLQAERCRDGAQCFLGGVQAEFHSEAIESPVAILDRASLLQGSGVQCEGACGVIHVYKSIEEVGFVSSFGVGVRGS